MAEISETSRRIWEEVKANHAKLDGCPLHDFQPVPGRHKHIPDYVCTKCRGKIDSIHRHWYKRCFEDGMRAANAENPTGNH